MRDALDLYPYPFINSSGETIPPFAIMQVGSGWTDANQRDYFNATKPNGSGKKFLINGPLSIPITSIARDGMASDLPGVYVRYSGSTPTAGQEWGPVASSWAISASGTGYLIIGDATTIDGAAVVRVANIPATNATVYEFRSCEDPARKLYLDNTEIGDHEPGEVAVIKLDGVFGCWQHYGPAPHCKTGDCAEIIAWGEDCDACSVCFYLTPCGGGSPTFVRGVEWYLYVGRVVSIDVGAGEGCYTVQVASECVAVTDYTVDDVVRSYENCDQCGCYELENCADAADVIYVANDLATIVGQATGADSIGEFVKHKGVCYEITDFLAPCTEVVEDPAWEDDDITRIESCNGCCWMLTPCPDQAGDPQPAYYRLQSGDPDLNEFVDDEGVSNGRVIRLAGICYTVSIPETCPEEDVILGLPTVEEEYDECGDCIVSCWERCDAAGTYLKTYSDMSEVDSDGVAKRAEDGYCYKRATLSECDGDPVVVFTIETIIDEGTDSCTICQTPKVKLTPSCGSGCSDCEGSSSGGSGSGRSAIVTDEAAFFTMIDQYVKNDGACYLVEWTTDALSGTLGCWTGPYTSCATCGAAPSTLTVIALVAGVHKNVKIQGSFNVCGESALSECEA